MVRAVESHDLFFVRVLARGPVPADAARVQQLNRRRENVHPLKKGAFLRENTFRVERFRTC
jgi:hypothetical protein